MHAERAASSRAPVLEKHGPPMTREQRDRFECDGFLVVPGALSTGEVERYTAALDEAYERERRAGPAGEVDATGSLHKMCAVAHCPDLVGLVAHPAVFPLVWSVLGWNVHVTHSHYDIHPPL